MKTYSVIGAELSPENRRELGHGRRKRRRISMPIRRLHRDWKFSKNSPGVAIASPS